MNIFVFSTFKKKNWKKTNPESIELFRKLLNLRLYMRYQISRLFFSWFRKEITLIFSSKKSMSRVNFDAIALKAQVSWSCTSEIFAALTCLITEKTKLKMSRLLRTSSKVYLSIDNVCNVEITNCLNFLINAKHHRSNFFLMIVMFFFSDR